jgi:hypothetical protein
MRRLLPEVPTPESLRKELFAAAASGNETQLAQLCRRHENLIFQKGLIWTQLPPPVLANPALLRWYDSGLTAIAAFGAQSLGKPELLQQIPAMGDQAESAA